MFLHSGVKSFDEGLVRDWFELAINAPTPVSDPEITERDAMPVREVGHFPHESCNTAHCPTCGNTLYSTALDGGFVESEYDRGRIAAIYRFWERSNAHVSNGNGWATPTGMQAAE